MYRVQVAATGIRGGAWLSTFYFDSASSTASQARDAVAAYMNSLSASVHNSVTMVLQPDVANIDEVTGAITSSQPVATLVKQGILTGSPAALSTQGLIRWKTGTYGGGRQIQGRTYVWGVTQTSLLDGGTSASYRSDVGQAVTAMLSTSPAKLVIWSRKLGTFAVVDSGTVWTELAVQRSRRD